MSPPARPVVLFDGACGLCDASVRFLLRRDKRGVFLFRPLQDAPSRAALAALGHPVPPDSIALLLDGRVLFRGDAALAIAARLPAPWPLFGVLRLVPRFLRDLAYDAVARRRHRWFSPPPACPLDARLPAERIWPGAT